MGLDLGFGLDLDFGPFNQASPWIALTFVYFDWESPRLGPGIDLEVASSFNRILTWESFWRLICESM